MVGRPGSPRGTFKDKPLLAEDLTAGNRYDAACAAALAGCGKGKDAEELSEKERTEWRRQALEWLRADLDLRRKQLSAADAKTTSQAQWELGLWQTDPNLACVRDKDALAELPEAERREWRKLWEDVACLRKPWPTGLRNSKSGTGQGGQGTA